MTKKVRRGVSADFGYTPRHIAICQCHKLIVDINIDDSAESEEIIDEFILNHVNGDRHVIDEYVEITHTFIRGENGNVKRLNYRYY